MSEKLRVLLVDDEPSILKTLGKRLEVAGFDVIFATDGEEALQKAQAELPDAMILDLMLPKRNGFEVCTILKADARYHDIPIVMLTARAQEGDERHGLECGADAYLRKPFQSKELLETIKGLVDRGRPNREVRDEQL